MKRLYEQLITWHFSNDQQMFFLSGPRQVGKTTISCCAKKLTDRFIYLNWDVKQDRHLIAEGGREIAKFINLESPSKHTPIIVFDEIHKYSKWKNFLKGFFDTYKGRVNIIVTGSAKLDIYQKGSDSLMGRYFAYRAHPLSIGECLDHTVLEQLIQKPRIIDDEQFNALWDFGGFPEPFIKRNTRFYNRWLSGRIERLFNEEIRSLTQIQEIAQMEILAKHIKSQVGELLNRSALSNRIDVALTTVKRWLITLEKFYYIYTIQPWSKNIVRSLTKEPKVYLWDWSELTDVGKRAENFIANHLLKAVHYWKDIGLGQFDLYFLRDKEKREVDFLVTKEGEPWFLVEVKLADNSRVSPHLYRFQEQLQAPHAFQVVIKKEFSDINCFDYNQPIIISARTFLSQLV